MYQISDLKSDLVGVLRGTTLNKVVGINDVISRAARHVIADVDMPETKRLAQLTNPIYDEVYDYVLPVDLKSNKIIDIRPINNRSIMDDFRTQSYSKDFEFLRHWITGNQFNIRTTNGIKTLRVSSSYLNPRTVINTLDSLSLNGSWAVGGGFGNLEVDTLQFMSGSAALRIDGTGTTGYMETSNMTAVDLSLYIVESALFMWVYIPNKTTFTSLNLRWGNSNTAYYNQTVTTGHSGALVTGWNLLRFDPEQATEIGSVDDTLIDYLRITANYTGDQTNLRFDSLTSNRGRIYDFEYYSKYLFRSTSDVWQERVLDDTDYVNADTDSYNLLLYKTAELIGLNIEESLAVRGRMVNVGQTTNGSMYDELLKEYKQTHKSEAIVPQQFYYRMPYGGRRISTHG